MQRIKLNNSKKELSIEEAFEKYQRNNVLKNLAEQTIKANNDKQKKFMKFINYENIPLTNVNKKLVDDYVLSLKNENIKISSVNIYLKYLRIFLYWCMQNNYVNDFKIGLLKQDVEVKQGYTEEQLKLLLKKPNTKKCTFAEYRNWVITNLLLSTGIRRNTLVNLKIGDLDFENDLILLTTLKNRKQQLIPMTSALRDVLLEYVDFRGGNNEDILFCSSTGSILTPEGFNKAIREYNHKRGIEKSGLHNFRRSFATMSVKNGVDLFKLQKLMSHSSIKTTQKYVHLTIEDLQENYEKYNPLDVMLINNRKNNIKMKK